MPTLTASKATKKVVGSSVSVRRVKGTPIVSSAATSKAKPPTKKSSSAVAQNTSLTGKKVQLSSTRKAKGSPPATSKGGSSAQQKKQQQQQPPPSLPFAGNAPPGQLKDDLVYSPADAEGSDNPWLNASLWHQKMAPEKFAESYRYQGQHAHGETGLGTHACPRRQPLRRHMNQSGCWHCPSESCFCTPFKEALDSAIDEVRAASNVSRQTEGGAGHKDLCAKSLEPQFIARVIRELNITKDDVFFDFGHGNGSVLFQVALETGARCVGIEINGHNADLSRLLWERMEPKLREMRSSDVTGAAAAEWPLNIELFTGDAAEYISPKAGGSGEATHFEKLLATLQQVPSGPRGPVILCSNKLWPRTLTNFVAERCRALPVGTRIFCMDDFYPHARRPDAEAEQLFQLNDYIWPLGVTEWAPTLEGDFYLHTKVKNRADLQDG